MLIQMENPRSQLENNRNFINRRPEKVKTNKFFSIRDIVIASCFIFCAGITLGIAIMEHIKH